MEDREIVELYWQRSQTAIAESQKKYENYCMKVALNVLSDWEDARECVNDVWLAAWDRIPPSRPEILSAFLGKIARRISIDCYRRQTAAKRGGNEITLAIEELEECLVARDTVDELLEQKELERLLNEFVCGLEEEKQDMFVRRYWYLDSMKQIAKRHKCSESKVRTTLFRCRKQLQEKLLEEGV